MQYVNKVQLSNNGTEKIQSILRGHYKIYLEYSNISEEIEKKDFVRGELIKNQQGVDLTQLILYYIDC